MKPAKHRLVHRCIVALALAGTALSVPASAQSDSEVRIKKLEAEVRALQRKVFPGADGKYFEPEISAPQVQSPAVQTATQSVPVNDLVGRIEAVESALARLTSQTEENSNRLAKLEARLAAEPAAGAATTAPAVAEKPAPTPSAIDVNTAAMTGKASAASTAKPSADRVAAVAAIEKPLSTDKGEDEYLYGYRLWEAKFYPEAAAQLKATVEKYPRHKRISYARNLLGRAYLDDGKPGTAAQWFLQNYQADKAGDRAPDSLLYLAVAMTRLNETKRACVALEEFASVYPQEAAGRLASQYGAAQKAVKCN